MDYSEAKDPIEFVEYHTESSQQGELDSAWLTGDLYQALARIGGTDNCFSEVVGLIEEMSRRYPETVMNGLSFATEGESVV